MKQYKQQSGFSAIIAIAIIVVIAVVGIGAQRIWSKSGQDDGGELTKKNSAIHQAKNGDSKEQEQGQSKETDNWTTVVTQDKAFSMKVPDGWKLTNYPHDFLGSTEVAYKPGIPATIQSSNTEYVGHSLRFRANVTSLDEAGLGPQWASPQPGLEESTQDFSIGALHGKRFKGVFSQDLNQTLYEYVFDLGSNKKLDIVYTVYQKEGEEDDVVTVEKAIRTIQLISP